MGYKYFSALQVVRAGKEMAGRKGLLDVAEYETKVDVEAKEHD